MRVIYSMSENPKKKILGKNQGLLTIKNVDF